MRSKKKIFSLVSLTVILVTGCNQSGSVNSAAGQNNTPSQTKSTVNSSLTNPQIISLPGQTPLTSQGSSGILEVIKNCKGEELGTDTTANFAEWTNSDGLYGNQPTYALAQISVGLEGRLNFIVFLNTSGFWVGEITYAPDAQPNLGPSAKATAYLQIDGNSQLTLEGSQTPSGSIVCSPPIS
jgi:hypothetical protein